MPQLSTNENANGLPARISECIRILRLPLVLGPVLVHSCLAPRSSPLQYVLARIIGDASVPALFFISGLLYFVTFDGSWACYRRKLASRVLSLGVPYLFWNLVCFIVFAYVVNIVARGDFPQAFWGVRVARRAGATAPVNAPLYYVKDVFLLALAAPVLHLGLSRKTLAWLSPAALAFWCLSPVAGLASRAIVLGTAFFAFGGFTAIHGMRLLDAFAVSRKRAFAAMSLFAAVSAAHAALHLAGHDWPGLYRLNIVCGIPFWFAVAARAGGKAAAILARAGNAAMFLFCTFDIVLVTLRHLFPFFFGRSDAVCLLSAILTVSASMALFALTAHFAPKTLKVLTGGR